MIYPLYEGFIYAFSNQKYCRVHKKHIQISIDSSFESANNSIPWKASITTTANLNAFQPQINCPCLAHALIMLNLKNWKLFKKYVPTVPMNMFTRLLKLFSYSKRKFIYTCQSKSTWTSHIRSFDQNINF